MRTRLFFAVFLTALLLLVIGISVSLTDSDKFEENKSVVRKYYKLLDMGEMEDIMSREYTVVIERDEEGYLIGSVPRLKGCHTQARTMDELLERMKEGNTSLPGRGRLRSYGSDGVTAF